MVDESLIAYLKTKLDAAAPAANNNESRLRQLFAYTDEPQQFTAPEVEILIDAINHLKSLDPAVGSGAFPMGILHKLVFILAKLDPNNEHWREVQRQRAIRETEETFKSGDKEERGRRLADINEVFEQNSSDYGRKLYLIENCIYGVDIQPIAVQIAKMRFFISLIVDQTIDDRLDNRGVRPLPNLETKFVAANTLIGLKRPGQQLLRNREIDAKEAELRRVRERHFMARTLAAKRKCRDQDAQLRTEIAELLKDDGWDNATAGKLASWDPYDQNASADFFDAEWMFGLTDGFDVAIANPPYVRQEKIKDLKPFLKAQGYECFEGVADLFVYFYEKSVKLLRTGGVLSFISSNKYYRAGYGEKLRGFLARELTLQQLIDFGDAPVFEAIAYASILAGVRAAPTRDASALAYTWEKEMAFDRIAQIVPERGQQIRQTELKPDGWRLESPAVLRLLEKLRRAGKPLNEYVNGRFYYGIKTGLNEAFVVDRATRDRLIREHKSSAEILKPFLRGRDVKRWRVEPQDLWLIFTRRGIDIKKYPAIYEHLLPLQKQLMPGKPGGRKAGSYEWYEIQDNIAYWQEFGTLKIVYPDIAPRCAFALDGDGLYPDCTLFLIPEATKWLLAVLNSQVVSFFFPKICPQIRGDFMRFKSIYMEQIPIPAVPTEKQKPLERLVERTLSAKQRDAGADVSTLEREIDQQVYALYGLTPEEIQIVEQSRK